MKQHRATHRPHLPQAKTSEREWESERALQPPLFVQLSLGNSTQTELTQTGVSLFLTTAVAAELDTVLPLIDFINYARLCVCVCAFLFDFICPASLALISLTIQYKFMHTLQQLQQQRLSHLTDLSQNRKILKSVP